MKKKLLVLVAVVGAALFVFNKAKSRNDDDLWQQATNG
ncbi:DLW-39 family protein [Pseudonocardia spinosispora]|nr:DLW-39 family protein [Pseudonocardia spinosispora]